MNKIALIIMTILLSLSCSDNKEFVKSESRYYYAVGKINGPVKSVHLTSTNDYNDDKTDNTYLIDTTRNELSMYNKDKFDKKVYFDSLGRADSSIWYKDSLKMKTIYHKSNFHDVFPICTMHDDSIWYEFNYHLDSASNTCTYYSDKGTLTRIDTFDIDGKLLVSAFDKITARYDYNEQGDLICETKIFNNSNKKFKSQIIDYKYDHYGNWTKKEIERYYRGQNKPEYTMTKKREIQYY
ncbi:hypothetical protein [Labilibaculum euxinus]|uniref:Uncharacterized protein n=1 Tax=Labilibaculum euxinus TaxID=2686357 RepID=A0A7M4DBW4_9BACT|nr:hypothetical protein [Labilibaculum euxinus]MUP40143.1 hypothetical protein [Labilibaculum euxinus]MVB09348.1 hypothetical protein [Labilibaculum euxinus]